MQSFPATLLCCGKKEGEREKVKVFSQGIFSLWRAGWSSIARENIKDARGIRRVSYVYTFLARGGSEDCREFFDETIKLAFMPLKDRPRRKGGMGFLMFITRDSCVNFMLSQLCYCRVCMEIESRFIYIV